MRSSRRARPQKPPVSAAPANPSATSAAAAAFMNRRDTSGGPGLSAAAAAAAIRAHPTPPTSVADVETDRIRQKRRSASVASSSRSGTPDGLRGKVAALVISGGAGAPALRRRGSAGSLSERTFRSPSPHRAAAGGAAELGSRRSSRDLTAQGPPVPTIPTALIPTPTSSPPPRASYHNSYDPTMTTAGPVHAQVAALGGQSSSSSPTLQTRRPTTLPATSAAGGMQLPAFRVASDRMYDDGEPSWFGPAKADSSVHVRTSDAPMHAPFSTATLPTTGATPAGADGRPGSAGGSSINFSYPARVRPTPPTSPAPGFASVHQHSPSTRPGPAGARTTPTSGHARFASLDSSQPSTTTTSRRRRRPASTMSSSSAGFAGFAGLPEDGAAAQLVYDPNTRRMRPRWEMQREDDMLRETEAASELEEAQHEAAEHHQQRQRAQRSVRTQTADVPLHVKAPVAERAQKHAADHMGMQQQQGGQMDAPAAGTAPVSVSTLARKPKKKQRQQQQPQQPDKPASELPSAPVTSKASSSASDPAVTSARQHQRQQQLRLPSSSGHVLGKKPSVVRESPEREARAAAEEHPEQQRQPVSVPPPAPAPPPAPTPQRITAALDSVPIRQQQHHQPVATTAVELPAADVVPPLESRQARSELLYQPTPRSVAENLRSRERVHSASPVRTAHFAVSPTEGANSINTTTTLGASVAGGIINNSLAVKHSPPPRSLSPMKSAMKQHQHHSPSPHRGPSPSTDTTASEASGSLDHVVSGPSSAYFGQHRDESLALPMTSAARKKSARVSWDDENTAVVGNAASPPPIEDGDESDGGAATFLASPQNRADAKKPWYGAVGRAAKKMLGDNTGLDAADNNTTTTTLDDQPLMEPRPALPSFGSVRERKLRDQQLQPQQEKERPLVRPPQQQSDPAVYSPSLPASPAILPSVATSVADGGRSEESLGLPAGASSDHVLGAVIAAAAAAAAQQNEQPALRHEANTSRFREPLPPVVTSIEGSGYHSDSSSSSSDDEHDDDAVAAHGLFAAPEVVEPTMTQLDGPGGAELEATDDEEATTPADGASGAYLEPGNAGQIPSISVSLPSPLQCEEDDKPSTVVRQRNYFPGHFPTDSSESVGSVQDVEEETSHLVAPAAEVAPNAHVSDDVSPNFTAVVNIPRPLFEVVETDESNNDVYSDAFEDLSDLDDDGYGSIAAAVESPVSPGLAQLYESALLGTPSPVERSRQLLQQAQLQLQLRTQTQQRQQQLQQQGRDSAASPPAETDAGVATVLPPPVVRPQPPSPPVMAGPSRMLDRPMTKEERDETWEQVKAYYRRLSKAQRRQLSREADEEAAGIDADLDEPDLETPASKKARKNRRPLDVAHTGFRTLAEEVAAVDAFQEMQAEDRRRRSLILGGDDKLSPPTAEEEVRRLQDVQVMLLREKGEHGGGDDRGVRQQIRERVYMIKPGTRVESEPELRPLQHLRATMRAREPGPQPPATVPVVDQHHALRTTMRAVQAASDPRPVYPAPQAPPPPPTLQPYQLVGGAYPPPLTTTTTAAQRPATTTTTTTTTTTPARLSKKAARRPASMQVHYPPASSSSQQRDVAAAHGHQHARAASADVMGSSAAPTQPAPPPPPQAAAASSSSSFATMLRPSLRRKGSTDSDSSFKRARLPTMAERGFARTSLRNPSPSATPAAVAVPQQQQVDPVVAGRPASASRFSLRSLSPQGSPFRRTNTASPTSQPPPVSFTSRMRRTLRSSSAAAADGGSSSVGSSVSKRASRISGMLGGGGGSSSSKAKTTTTTPTTRARGGFVSRLGDSSDEDLAARTRARFTSRFADSSDEEEEVAPRRGNVPAPAPALDEKNEDSPDLPDSSDDDDDDAATIRVTPAPAPHQGLVIPSSPVPPVVSPAPPTTRRDSLGTAALRPSASQRSGPGLRGVVSAPATATTATTTMTATATATASAPAAAPAARRGSFVPAFLTRRGRGGVRRRPDPAADSAARRDTRLERSATALGALRAGGGHDVDDDDVDDEDEDEGDGEQVAAGARDAPPRQKKKKKFAALRKVFHLDA